MRGILTCNIIRLAKIADLGRFHNSADAGSVDWAIRSDSWCCILFAFCRFVNTWIHYQKVDDEIPGHRKNTIM